MCIRDRLYSLLLDRSTLSQKNGWQDIEGRTYIVYPIAEMAEVMKKGSTTIKLSLIHISFFAAQYSRSVIRSLLPFKRSIW